MRSSSPNLRRTASCREQCLHKCKERPFVSPFSSQIPRTAAENGLEFANLSTVVSPVTRQRRRWPHPTLTGIAAPPIPEDWAKRRPVLLEINLKFGKYKGFHTRQTPENTVARQTGVAKRSPVDVGTSVDPWTNIWLRITGGAINRCVIVGVLSSVCLLQPHFKSLLILAPPQRTRLRGVVHRDTTTAAV